MAGGLFKSFENPGRMGFGAVMTATSVTISERAARRIGEILKTEGDGAMLRISVEGGGCSGFQYKFDVERAQAEDDLVIARDNAVVLVELFDLTSLIE